MAQTSLPPGFRFHPTDVELCSYYLKRKIMGKKLLVEAISEVELYKYAPWDLPDKSCLKNRDMEWYFFCPREKKAANSSRTNRITPNGFWKSTGKDRTIVLDTRIVGMKKTLVFHEAKAPRARGDRTNWVMYEYRMEANELDVAGFSKDAYVLCKIFKKSAPGPKIGEQYGATFDEEEWDNINTETAFPLMPCPSSKVGATNEPPVQHTVASTSRVMKEPHVLTVSADGLPFEFSTSSITAIDELHHHTLRRNGSKMVTANCASDALDAGDPTEFGGISLEETDKWIGFLTDSVDNDGDASEKLAGFPAISEAEAQALEMNSEYCYDELVKLVESGGVSTANNLSPGYVKTECLNPPMVSGLGAGDDYLEIDDLFPLGETASFELPTPESLYPQHHLEQCQYNELNRHQYHNKSTLAASLVAGDLFPPISNSMHGISVDDISCSTNCMWNDCSNSTVWYPFS